MTTTATHNVHATTTPRALFMACARSEKPWQRGCTIGPGQQPRERAVAARHPARVLQEVTPANRRLGLPASAPVVSGDEAGRAGCWRHRFLHAQGLTTHGVDASSLAVNRCQRRAKSDGVDVRKWVRLLMCYAHGDREG
jgi:hypothetical protein